MIVICDTSPLHYLVLVGAERDVLHGLVGVVHITPAIVAELSHPRTPTIVREWAARPPAWMTVAAPRGLHPGVAGLDAGEAEAISLAMEQRATLLVIDDQPAKERALSLGLRSMGTLALIAIAAERTLIDRAQVIDRLAATSFRADRVLLERFRAGDPKILRFFRQNAALLPLPRASGRRET